MTLSVIIRSYTEDRWDFLVAAVESLRAQTRPPDELVLVVDHNPTLFERVRRAFPDATTVASATRGDCGAWNRGIESATGDIVAFIDDDAAAEPDWLEQLVAPYEDERVVGVGGTIVPDWLAGRPAWFPAEFHWVVGCSYRGMPTTVAPMRNLLGCNMSFRRSALVEIGGLREIEGLGHMGTLPIGGGETELCIRLGNERPGSVLLHQPAAVVHHKVPASRGRFRYFTSRCWLEGTSKAIISGLVGTGQGLSTEASYTLKVLPSGVLRGISDAVRGDPGGIGRSGAIVAGVGTATISYVGARLRLAGRRRASRNGAGPHGGA